MYQVIDTNDDYVVFTGDRDECIEQRRDYIEFISQQSTMNGEYWQDSIKIALAEKDDTDWIQELQYYHEFMGWNYESDISDIKRQDEAKTRLREDLEYVIGTNGWSALFTGELELAKKLGINRS